MIRVKRKERLKSKSILDFKPTPIVEEKEMTFKDNIKRKPRIFILGISVSLLLILIAFGTFLSIKNSNDVPDYMTSEVREIQPITPQPIEPTIPAYPYDNGLEDSVTNFINTLVSYPLFMYILFLPFLFITYKIIRDINRRW